ncbi:MAG: hypothetical protein QW666_01560 [Candidatus Woesearchaeota archaeon]
MGDNLLVRTIIQMLGAPKEYIEETLKKYIEKLKKDGLQITKENYAPAEKKGELFGVFVELELKFKSAEELLDFCFDSMPASVEILEPEELHFNSNALTGLLNDMQAKLHEVDMIVKSVRAQNKVLDTNALNVFNNFIIYVASKEPKTTEEISAAIGTKPTHLQPFINKLVDAGKLKKEGDKYIKNE